MGLSLLLSDVLLRGCGALHPTEIPAIPGATSLISCFCFVCDRALLSNPVWSETHSAAQVKLGLLAIFLLWLSKAEITEVSHGTWPRVFLRGAIHISLYVREVTVTVYNAGEQSGDRRHRKHKRKTAAFPNNPRWGRGGYLRTTTPPKPQEGKGVFREKGGRKRTTLHANSTPVCSKSDLLSTGRSSAKCCCSKLYWNPTKNRSVIIKGHSSDEWQVPPDADI